MKNLILIIVVCVSAMSVRAQAISLQVVNLSSCEVFYQINGDIYPGCGNGIASSFLSLAAGGTVTYATSAAIPGFPALVAAPRLAKVFSSATTCLPMSVQYVGDACGGFPASVMYKVLANPSCVFCASITATWTPATVPGGTATLVFN